MTDVSAIAIEDISAPAGLSTSWFTTWDNHQLRVDIHHRSDTPHAIVLILPIGITSHPILPLIAKLGEWSSVYALYSRFVLDHAIVLGPEHVIDASAHARDVVALVEHFDLSDFGLVGYCTGALVAVRSAFLLAHRVATMVCCSGAFELSRRTEYECELDDLVSACAGQRRMSRAVRKVLYAKQNAEAEFYEYTRTVLRDDETFYKYVTSLQAMYAEGFLGIDRLIEVQTLLIAGSADHIVSPENSHVPRAYLAKSELRMLGGADHYFPCRHNAEGLDIINDFLHAGAMQWGK